VANIHRIADLIQGVVIAPGTTFSVNDHVGRRTIANGFVAAPVIDHEYKFTEDVGGGISQFATTIFNAAFFAGLDIPSYYMHGIYIARYPYGRESTISFPSPDVRIRNNTPHGVLIWPTYTATSITVTMYSTKYVSGEQTNQTTAKKGVCTEVTTERTRTYVDGRKTTDRFSGLYSPEEGVKCE
jgi:vancomycin resistance protein YoaR